MEQLARSARAWRLRFHSLPSLSSRRIHRSLYPKSASASSTSSDVSSFGILRGDTGPYSLLPVVLAGIFGIGLAEKAYADAPDQAIYEKERQRIEELRTSREILYGSESDPRFDEELQETAKVERQRIEELRRYRGILHGSYPRVAVAVKGQKVSIKFQIPPGVDVSQLIANLMANLGLKAEGRGGGSDLLLRAWDSTAAWQLALTYPSKQKHIQQNEPSSTEINAHDGDLCVLIFQSLIGSDKAEIEFIKQGNLSPEELDAFISVLRLAGNKLVQRNTLDALDRFRNTWAQTRQPQVLFEDKSISSLEATGVRIYGLNEPVGISNGEISWDNIAGVIEDTILLALHSPKVYDDIARGTRHKFESNKPRAVLFEGPPGTGKTSCARVIANQAGVPLLYVPVEAIMSELYGKSERLLGNVFSVANDLPNGAIIFLDEIDSFATARDSVMHEATRRILSVLLRQIDGFEQDKKMVVIAATNKKEDLDPALISRFDITIAFGLPDHHNRQEIAFKYAKHLSKAELDELATVTEDMSGRDIRDVCLQAERSWASKEYIACASNRREALRRPSPMQILTSFLKAKNWF